MSVCVMEGVGEQLPHAVLCGDGARHAALPGEHICCVVRTSHGRHVFVPVAIRKYKES